MIDTRSTVNVHQRLLKLTFLLLIGVVICSSFGNKNDKSSQFTMPGSTYKIENQQDHLYLTVSGVNGSFASVVSDNFFNFKEQRWELQKLAGTTAGTYHLIPRKHPANNFLSYFRTEGKKYPDPVTWSLLEVSPGNSYQMQNSRTRFCLATAGRRKAVIELPCDHFQKTQLWKFTKI